MGPSSHPYMSNWPTRESLLKYLVDRHMDHYLEYLLSHGF
jgi:hypothetical protein